MSLTKATYSMIEGAPANVLDYGADPTGQVDSTDAFNRALNYDVVITDNAQNGVRRTVIVPEGNYLIEGTVYIQKGMHLKGSGFGPARITVPVVDHPGPTFLMGWGVYNGVPTQSGSGLPPSISDLLTEGGSTNTLGYIVDTGAIAGVNVYNLFITTAPSGVNINCGDLQMYNIIFDNCATSVVINTSSGSSRNVIVACDFYFSQAYGILIAGYAYDTIVSDCNFNFSKINDIYVDPANSQLVKNLNINNCTFSYNSQWPTNTGSIVFNASNSDFSVQSCNFRNNPEYSVIVGGANNTVDLFDNIFDGTKTNHNYTQGSTAKVSYISGTGHNINISGNSIMNQSDATSCIETPGTQFTTINFTNNSWNSVSAPEIIKFSGNNSGLVVNAMANTGDSVTPLFNLSDTATFYASSNVKWFGPWIAGTGVQYIKIPSNGYLNAVVGLSAQTNPGGSVFYNKSGYYSVVRYTDDLGAGAGVDDYVVKTNIYEVPTSGNAPNVNPSVTLDTPTGGTSANYLASRYVVVSVSDAFNMTSATVDCL
jgi:hypothetical protein